MATKKRVFLKRQTDIPEDLVWEMRDWWAAGLPTAVLVRSFQKRGFNVQPTLLRIWCKRMFPEVASGEIEMLEELKNEDQPRQAMGFAWYKLLHYVRQIDADKPSDMKRLLDLVGGVGKLVSAQVALDKHELDSAKWEEQRDKYTKRARDLLMREIRAIMSDRPELVREIYEIFNEATRSVTAGSQDHEALPPGSETEAPEVIN